MSISQTRGGGKVKARKQWFGGPLLRVEWNIVSTSIDYLFGGEAALRLKLPIHSFRSVNCRVDGRWRWSIPKYVFFLYQLNSRSST